MIYVCACSCVRVRAQCSTEPSEASVGQVDPPAEETHAASPPAAPSPPRAGGTAGGKLLSIFDHRNMIREHMSFDTLSKEKGLAQAVSWLESFDRSRPKRGTCSWCRNNRLYAGRRRLPLFEDH